MPSLPQPTHPVLKPALRRVWRDPATLQLGVGADRAVVVAGIGTEDARLLDLLDGTRALPDVLTQAGVDTDRGGELVALLRAADALDEAVGAPGNDARLAPDRLALSLRHRGYGAATVVLTRRAQRAVVIHGAGRVGAAVAGLLAAAAVGSIDVVDRGGVRAADLSPAGIRRPRPGTRAAAALETLPRRSGSGRARGATAGPYDLAIVSPVGSVAAPETLAAVRAGPHLLVAVRQNVAAVGPLVIPGRTPCLRCVELARGDRDPGWPAVAAQLVGSGSAVEACDIVLATLAASLAATQALAFLDAGSEHANLATAGGILEFALRTGRLRRRSVAPHPACGCCAGPLPDTMEE